MADDPKAPVIYRYAKVDKDGLITGLAKLEDPPMPMEPGETTYIMPSYDPKNVPEVGWRWNDASPIPMTTPPAEPADA
jgi:hypothetical protein